MHLTKVPYLPGPDDPDPKRGQPSNNPTPEQREATREAFFRLQDHYFSLPKDQRIPFLHQVYQQQFGKILPEHQAADGEPRLPQGKQGRLRRAGG